MVPHNSDVTDTRGGSITQSLIATFIFVFISLGSFLYIAPARVLFLLLPLLSSLRIHCSLPQRFLSHFSWVLG